MSEENIKEETKSEENQEKNSQKPAQDRQPNAHFASNQELYERAQFSNNRERGGRRDGRQNRDRRNQRGERGEGNNRNFRDRDNRDGQRHGKNRDRNNQNNIFKSKLGVDEGKHGNGALPSGSVGTWAGNFLEIENDLIEKIRREAKSKYMEPSYLANTILREAFGARKRQEGNQKTSDVISNWVPQNIRCPKCKHEFSLSRQKDKFRGKHKKDFQRNGKNKHGNNRNKVGLFKRLINKVLALFKR